MAPAANMFQRNIDELLHELHNVFGITDNILIAGFEDLGRDQNDTEKKVLEIYRKANVKLTKEKCHFRFSSIPFFGKVISWDSSRPDPRKFTVLIDMPPPKCRKELQSFLGMINYLSNLSPATAEACEMLMLCKVVGYNMYYLCLYIPFSLLLLHIHLGLIILNLNFCFLVAHSMYTTVHNYCSCSDSLSLKTHAYILWLE